MKLQEHQKFRKAKAGDWLVVPKDMRFGDGWVRSRLKLGGNLSYSSNIVIDGGVYKILYINQMDTKNSRIKDLVIQFEDGDNRYAIRAEDLRSECGYFRDRFTADVAFHSGNLQAVNGR